MPGPANALNINQEGVQYFDGVNSFSGLDGGTAGNVLTSNGTNVAPSFQSNPGSTAIQTIDGDNGSVSGTTVTVFANQATLNSGSSVAFANSGTTSTLNVTDGGLNTIIGQGAGVTPNSASSCTGLGYQALASITDDDNHVAIGRAALQSANDGSSNTAVGAYALNALVAGGDNTAVGAHAGISLPNGNFNTMIGYFAGTGYTNAESSNILIGNAGTASENNTIRIGDQGSGNLQQNRFFAAGVAGVSVSNTEMVTIDTTTGQMGSQTLPSGTFYSITPYIVGPDVNSQYSTIQAAINQAITDGASDSTPKNIYVKPGTYTETLTGAAGIRIIGLSIPAVDTPNTNPNLSVIWVGVCTWASGAMEFENIRTGYAGSGNIFTIPASGKLVLTGCQLNNPGSAGNIIVDGGSAANLYMQNCQPGNNVGQLINSSHTGFVAYINDSSLAAGGGLTTVGGTWTLNNVTMDAFWIMGNTEAYSVTFNGGSFVSGGQFRSSANSQSGNVLKCNYVNFNYGGSGTAIQNGTVSTLIINECSGNPGTVVDDSSSAGGNTILFLGGSFQSANLASLGAGSVLQQYNTVSGAGPLNTVSNSVAVSTSASDGFQYLPSCAGTPTGTPTTNGDGIPTVVDSTANTPYIYSSGAWHAVGGGGSSFSLSPYICGPTGDTNAQFTGDTAIADALAQIVTDAPTNATIFIKAGSYASGGFTIPALGSGNPIVFIGETLPPGSLQDHSGIGSALQPQVSFQGAITGTGACAMQFIQIQGAFTAAQGSQFEWCSFQSSGGTFTVSDSIRCQFTDCYIGGSVSSISNKYLLASFDRCQIDTQINTVSANGDYFLFNGCYFTNNSSIVNTATSGPGLEAYNCRVDSSTWINESTATNPFTTMKLDNIYFSNQVVYVFQLAASGRGWSDISNLVYNGSNYLIDDTAGTGSNNIQISNSTLLGGGAILNLSNNDGIVIKNSVFRSSSGISAGNNTTVQLVNCDTFTSQPPTSLGTNSTFTNFVISAPIDSHTTTTGGGVAGVTVGGGAVQNNANCDVVVNISVEVTSAAGGQLTLGVGPSSTPTADPVTVPLTVASSTAITITAYVPYQYYIILDTTGTITTGTVVNWVGAS